MVRKTIMDLPIPRAYVLCEYINYLVNYCSKFIRYSRFIHGFIPQLTVQ